MSALAAISAPQTAQRLTGSLESAPAEVGLFKRLEAQRRRDSQRLVASVPDGKLQVVPGGHFIQEEHPAVVIAAISAELKKAR